MFTGHFAVAIAGAGTARRVPLGLLIVAAFGADLLEGMIAVFKMADPTRIWSHSFPATVATGLLLGLGWRLVGGSWREALVVLVVAASHSALDYVTGFKTVWPGNGPVGLGWYSRPYVDAAIEGLLCVAAWLVWRASLARDRRMSLPAWAMLGVLLAASGAALAHLLYGGLTAELDSLSKFVR